MAITVTSTAMTMVSRNMPSGTIARSVTYNNSGVAVTASASANALQIQFCRIPNKASIMYLSECHSSGAATCLADVGIKDQVLTLSAFMTQVTAGQNNVAKPFTLPYVVSITDTQATKYAYLVAGLTVGTNTSSFKMTLNCIYTMDPQ